MKTFQPLEERQLDVSSPAMLAGSAQGLLRDPRTAALLSLIPGLGQLYNGETGKGLLFLAVSAVNLLILSLILFARPIVQQLAKVADGVHLQLNWGVVSDLAATPAGWTVLAIYLGLLISFVIYALKDAYDHAVSSRQGTNYARFFLGLPEATSGSYLFHFAVVASLILSIFLLAAPKPPAEQGTIIELVPPQPPPPAAPAPKRPKMPVKIEVPKQIPPVKHEPPARQPVKIPPAATPVAVAIPTTAPSPLAVGPVTAPPVETTPAPSGGVSGQGPADSQGSSKEIDFSSYLSEMQRRIKKSWFPPRGNESKRITVRFKIHRDGEITGIKLVESSGLAIADSAATVAIEHASPLPALPDGSPEEVVIKFTFDYNVFTGQGSNAVQKP